MRISAIDVSAEKPYQVVVGRGALDLLPQYLADQRRIAVLHPAVLRDLAAEIGRTCDAEVLTIEVLDAEGAKTVATLQRCWDALAGAGFTRSDAIIGLGGATTDLAGFVAATWLRGVRYVSIPTTVLGMVDAAVGGKTGINLSAGEETWSGPSTSPTPCSGDLGLLENLPVAEIRSGMAEVVKAGFIADPAILTIIEDDPAEALNTKGEVICVLVKRAIAVKAAGGLRPAGTHWSAATSAVNCSTTGTPWRMRSSAIRTTCGGTARRSASAWSSSPS